MTTEIATRGGGEVVTRDYLNERRELIRSQLSPGASDVEIELLIETAAARGLNPITRQIYGVMRGGRMTIQTGIDGFRLIAQRTGEYAGQVGPEWCGPDGQWRDVWLETSPPAAARVGVMRKGWHQPTYAVARWASYAQQSATWKSMPDLMLAKCAEALALRKAFPEDLSGLYTSDEMGQADLPPAHATPAPDPAGDLVRSRVKELRGVLSVDFLGGVMKAAGIASTDLVDDEVYERAKGAMADAVAARTQEVAAEESAAGETVDTVTAAQMKALHAVGKAHGLDHEALHALAHEKFGVESMREIPRDGMDAMLEAIQTANSEAL